VRQLRLSVVLRGYRMDEVDWVLDVLAGQLEERDREIARLRAAAGETAEPAVEAPPLVLPAEPVEPALLEPVEAAEPGAQPAGPARPGEVAAVEGRDGAEPPDRAGSELPAEPASGPAADRGEASALRGFADSPMDRAVRAARAGVAGPAHAPAAEAGEEPGDG
jgi:DivIVA domain-containing protein